MSIDFSNYLTSYPSKDGMFGDFGGIYLNDELNEIFKNLATQYERVCKEKDFIMELKKIRKEYQGRPTPIYYCKHLSEALNNGSEIYLKREDLNHTGSHKLNNAMGEALFAKRIGKKKLIAETGAGSHGVAIATAAAYFGMECEVHMGKVDIEKQAINVAKMKILGAKIVEVSQGTGTLKDAVDSAINAFIRDSENSIYCIGSSVGPHPFPILVREFQKIIGDEAKEQFLEMTNCNPDAICACVGGGSNSIGFFVPFLSSNVEIFGVEPFGCGKKIGEHSASITYGKKGIVHGFKSYLICDKNGGVSDAYSIASGLDYPAVGPEHAFLHEAGRVKYVGCFDDDAVKAFFMLSKMEGIIPALESAHAISFALKYAKENSKKKILVCLSGRGDKDVDFIVSKYGTDYLENLECNQSVA